MIPLDYWSSREIFNARSMPLALAFLGTLVSMIIIIRTSPSLKFWIDLNWQPLIYMIILMIAYSIGFNYLGFLLSSVLFLGIAFYLLGNSNLMVILLIPVLLIGAFWLVMKALGIYLEPGALWYWLLAMGSS